MKRIKLTKGKYTIVDIQDFEYLIQQKWHLSSNGYACGITSRKKGKQQYIRMHRLILNAPKNVQVDHINGNKLDNRRSNLRLCSKTENTRNRKIQYNNKAGYKGVHWHKSAKKWKAQISVNGKVTHLGLFSNKITAAKAYDFAAKKYHKQFAKCNFK